MTGTFTDLLDKYLTNSLTSEEEQQLIQLASQPANQSVLSSRLDADLLSGTYAAEPDSSRHRGIYDALQQKMATPTMQPATHRIHFLKTAWFRYAAVLLLIAGTTTFLYRTFHKPQEEITRKHPDIQPGRNKAILTLSDGSTVILDSAAIGNVASQGATTVIKLDAGKLAYQGKNGSESLYNTIATPKGGQYQIVLSDGTEVWLNAASSIRFPTTFVKERKVAVTGEVYMEIAEDKQKPFFVTANNVEIQVLGTSFNINSYPDEKEIQTTLLEGSIKLITGAATRLLKPGQSGLVAKTGLLTINDNTDLEKTMAWKNGLFNFEGADLPAVMRQLGRWYDIEVAYEGKITERKFKGKLQRSLNLSQILQALEYMQVKFRLEDRRLIVYQ